MDKKYFSIDEVSKATGMSKSSIYKLTANRVISYFKPFGKRIFFTQEQIDSMMTKTRIKTNDELSAELANQKGGRS